MEQTDLAARVDLLDTQGLEVATRVSYRATVAPMTKWVLIDFLSKRTAYDGRSITNLPQTTHVGSYPHPEPCCQHPIIVPHSANVLWSHIVPLYLRDPEETRKISSSPRVVHARMVWMTAAAMTACEPRPWSKRPCVFLFFHQRKHRMARFVNHPRGTLSTPLALVNSIVTN